MKSTIILIFSLFCCFSLMHGMERPEVCLPNCCKICAAATNCLLQLSLNLFMKCAKGGATPKADLDRLMNLLRAHDNYGVEKIIWGQSIQSPQFSPQALTAPRSPTDESPLLCSLRLMRTNFSARICASLLVRVVGCKESLCKVIEDAPSEEAINYLENVLSLVSHEQLLFCSDEPFKLAAQKDTSGQMLQLLLKYKQGHFPQS